ncbi:alpha-glucosidase family protein [Mesorhizobium sp. RP14(2022)]|uniref:Alpha-glucosidase family protein n=1 Tax=Mesorhizobium liriopis TaxID=2953882 RepID=A0ABT1C272_9HYPH|nr:alpha-glucosidase family protein [Mesorhizobium liriopis]MCO6048932.1 alpha-glucosidase family protein [Mesorhizobium liriopis]
MDARVERAAGTAGVGDADWWRGAVIYQIYPRSFQDTNGDGIGDLAGITKRLPYVASLGVDAIWISPFFPSPMKDFGYDVSDYCGVDPMFGTLDDFDALIAEAHRLGLKVMIDQVISHTSDLHPWFRESRKSRDNPKSDWYVWTDAKPDGTPPNNWLSVFGGSSWEWDTGRRQYYLHNFLTTQPDLNFHNPHVQDAVLGAVRFWLERGVDGFRLDTVNFYFHSEGLENNPALPIEKRNDKSAPAVNPYGYQDHVYDKNRPENVGFLERFRALLDEYQARAAVGEVGEGQRGTELMAEYTSGTKRLQMCYSFELLTSAPLSPGQLKETLEEFDGKAPDGWACWATSNHDVERTASRWGDNVAPDNRTAFTKLVASLLLSLRGSVCLYQGEELGLTEAQLRFEDLQDPYGIRFWPDFKGRDGCRTPMVWDAGDKAGGFSSGKPWLPVPPEHLLMAVSAEEDDDASVLAHYRRFLRFRKTHPSLQRGSILFLKAEGDVLAFRREWEGETLVCAFNLGEVPAEIALEDADGCATLPDSGHSGTVSGDTITLPPLGAWFGRHE